MQNKQLNDPYMCSQLIGIVSTVKEEEELKSKC